MYKLTMLICSMVYKVFIALCTVIMCMAVNMNSIYNDYIESTVLDIVSSCRRGNSQYKAYKTIFYAKKYGHDPILFARLIQTESDYKQTCHNKYSGACGYCQIVTNIHKVKNVFNIDINMNYGAKLLRDYYISTGSYKKAITRYGGYSGIYRHRKKQKQIYLNKIIGKF